MSITLHIYYSGKPGAAKGFAEEMIAKGIVDAIRKEAGNLCYEYYFPMQDTDTVLLIDSWENQEAIDVHHATWMMDEITKLREKYDLHMKVERFVSEDLPSRDRNYIREKKPERRNET